MIGNYQSQKLVNQTYEPLNLVKMSSMMHQALKKTLDIINGDKKNFLMFIAALESDNLDQKKSSDLTSLENETIKDLFKLFDLQFLITFGFGFKNFIKETPLYRFFRNQMLERGITDKNDQYQVYVQFMQIIYKNVEEIKNIDQLTIQNNKVFDKISQDRNIDVNVLNQLFASLIQQFLKDDKNRLSGDAIELSDSCPKLDQRLIQYLYLTNNIQQCFELLKPFIIKSHGNDIEDDHKIHLIFQHLARNAMTGNIKKITNLVEKLDQNQEKSLKFIEDYGIRLMSKIITVTSEDNTDRTYYNLSMFNDSYQSFTKLTKVFNDLINKHSEHFKQVKAFNEFKNKRDQILFNYYSPKISHLRSSIEKYFEKKSKKNYMNQAEKDSFGKSLEELNKNKEKKEVFAKSLEDFEKSLSALHSDLIKLEK